MLRRLFTLASAVSLVLFVGMAVLWIVSLKAVPSARWCFVAGKVNQLAVYRGRIVFAQWEESPVLHDGATHSTPRHPRLLTQPGVAASIEPTIEWDEAQSQGWRIGEDVRRFAGITSLSAYTYREITVSPVWPLALFSLLPVYRIARSLRRRQAGRCRCCGYDLRATPNRCPECGRIPAKPA